MTEPPPDASFPSGLAEFLPPDTVATWRKIAPVLPTSAYLVGGTALTVHLQHRISRDLDFFFDEEVDIDGLEATLQTLGTLATTSKDTGTLNGVLDATKIQFLDARGQTQLAPMIDVAAIRVASVDDILAMKLKVIIDRGELRDYFDLMCIDQEHIPVEEGVALFMRRYGVARSDNNIVAIVGALAYFDDVADDPMLPVERSEIERYWATRGRAAARSFDRF